MMKSRLFTAAMILASSTSTISVAAASIPTTPSHCTSLFIDFQRRQRDHFQSATPFTIADGGAGAEAKHVPFLTVDSGNNDLATIVVGNGDVEGGVWHPMVASDSPEEVHWITHIMAVDQNGELVAMHQLNANTDSYPFMTLTIPPGVTQLTPYAWCNLHGLWVGDTVDVDVGVSAEDADAAASEAAEPWEVACTVGPFHEDSWPSLHADFMRLQGSVFQSDVPFDESNGEKHVPYITLSEDKSSGSIFVGNPNGDIHPMDGDSPHWITEVYVVDQTGKIIDLTSLDPTYVDSATYEFDIPEETVTSVKAYAWCNIHGLYESPLVALVGQEQPKSGDVIGEEVNTPTGSSSVVGDIGGVRTVLFTGVAFLAGFNAL